MNKTLSMLGFLAASLVLFSGTSMAQDSKAPQATMVGADKVQYRTMSQTVPITGRLVARQSGVVAARINAPVAEMLVDVGDKVFEGQPLVRLVSDRLEHKKSLALGSLQRAEAALQTAKAELNIVTQELKRLERLRKSAAFNQARYDDKRLETLKASSAMEEAEAAVRTAKADLALAELDIAYSEIKAPYPGTITLRHVDRGDYVSVGQTVLNLINANNLEIEADVPAARIDALSTGTSVNATLANGTTVALKIRAIIPEENPLTRTRAVRFTPDFNQTDYHLASNQTLTVLIPQGQAREVLSVHKDAILNKKGSTIVYVIKDGQAKLSPVQLGDAIGNYFEVLSGLEDGDQVVTRGNERLRPNQPVQAMGSQS